MTRTDGTDSSSDRENDRDGHNGQDNFDAELSAIRRLPPERVDLTALAMRYAYVHPTEPVLAALARLGPLVEVGAGTGYWAHRLRRRGVDIVAFDQAPPDAGERDNRYHGITPTWTAVLAGDQSVLADHADRTLLLCWAPLFSSLADCLDHYAGSTVACIGDGGQQTTRLRGLAEAFTLIEVMSADALEPMDGAPPTLSIWRRRPRHPQ